MSEIIRSLRLKTPYTQHDVARFCGVSQAAVCSWENGTRVPSKKQIPKLAKILGVNAADLSAP